MELGNLSRWEKLAAGKSLKVGSKDVQRLRLLVNSPSRAVLWFKQGKVETLLAVVDGYEEIVFGFAGTGEIQCETDIWFYASEKHQFSVETVAPTFTVIAERKARNPEMELLMRTMMQNVDRRLQSQQMEHTNSIQRLMEENRLELERKASAGADGEKAIEPAQKPDGTPEGTVPDGTAPEGGSDGA